MEVSGELNGRMSTHETRLHDLIDERAPELAELLRNDDAVEVHYSDRYLKSPWAVCQRRIDTPHFRRSNFPQFSSGAAA